jgi:hypothetical protein
LCTANQAKALTVWSAKVSQLAHSRATAARFAAFAFLTRTAAAAQHGALTVHLTTWLELASLACVDATSSEPVAHVRGIAALALATLVARALRWSDTRRAVAQAALGKILSACVAQIELADALDDELFSYWSVALATLMRSAPQATRAHADRLERALLRCLGCASAVKRHRAAACLALLPCSQIPARGPQQQQQQQQQQQPEDAGVAAAVDAHGALALKLVGLAHDVLDVTLASVVEPAENDELRVEPSAVGAQRVLLGALPDESGAAIDVLELRFEALCDALSLLFRVEPPIDLPSKRRLPLRAAAALALRILGVGSVMSRSLRTRRGVNQLDGVPLLARQDVTAALPSLHATALTLLGALLEAASTRLLPYADVICEATLAVLARSATPRAAAAAALASTAAADGASSAAAFDSGAHFYSEEAAKSAILHAPTRPHAYVLAAHLLRVGGAGLDATAFFAPLLAHAVCDLRRAEDAETAASVANQAARKRKRSKGTPKSSGGAAPSDTETAMVAAEESSINLTLRDHVSDAARLGAVRVLADALLCAPLVLTAHQKRAAAQAVLDLAGADVLASLASQSAATSENTASLIATRGRPETARMRAALVDALDVVARRVAAGAAVANELLKRLAHDPAPSVSRAARNAIMREVHVESSIIKMAEAALVVGSGVERSTDDIVSNDDDQDDDDQDDADQDDEMHDQNDDSADADDGIAAASASFALEAAPVGEAPYVEPTEEAVDAVADEAHEQEEVAEVAAEQTEQHKDEVDDGSASESPSSKRRHVAPVPAPPTQVSRARVMDGDSDDSSLPEIVVASPDEADLL